MEEEQYDQIEDQIAPVKRLTKAQQKRLERNGVVDRRSITSKANMAKAREKVQTYMKTAKTVLKSDDLSEDGDEVIDVVLKKKVKEPEVVEQVPLKELIKIRNNKKKVQYEDEDEEDDYAPPKRGARKAPVQRATDLDFIRTLIEENNQLKQKHKEITEKPTPPPQPPKQEEQPAPVDDVALLRKRFISSVKF